MFFVIRYFNRDVNCIRTFFSKKFGYEGQTYPRFDLDTTKKVNLDVLVEASGFSKKNQQDLEKVNPQSC